LGLLVCFADTVVESFLAFLLLRASLEILVHLGELLRHHRYLIFTQVTEISAPAGRWSADGVSRPLQGKSSPASESDWKKSWLNRNLCLYLSLVKFGEEKEKRKRL